MWVSIRVLPGRASLGCLRLPHATFTCSLVIFILTLFLAQINCVNILKMVSGIFHSIMLFNFSALTSFIACILLHNDICNLSLESILLNTGLKVSNIIVLVLD